MSLCGRLGPVLSSAVQIGRYLGTRVSVDPAYKVVRSGALAEYTRWKDRTVIDGILGIDVSKNTLDASMSSCNNRVRTICEFLGRMAPSPGFADHPEDPTGSCLYGIHRALQPRHCVRTVRGWSYRQHRQSGPD